MGTSARHHISGVGLSVKLQSGLLPTVVLTNGNRAQDRAEGPGLGPQTSAGYPRAERVCHLVGLALRT